MKKLILAGTGLALMGSAHAAGWIKANDISCDAHSDCQLIDNYTDAHRHHADCAMFAVPVWDRPNGKVVGALIADFDIKSDTKRDGFVHVKSKGIGAPLDFKQCG